MNTNKPLTCNVTSTLPDDQKPPSPQISPNNPKIPSQDSSFKKPDSKRKSSASDSPGLLRPNTFPKEVNKNDLTLANNKAGQVLNAYHNGYINTCMQSSVDGINMFNTKPRGSINDDHLDVLTEKMSNQNLQKDQEAEQPQPLNSKTYERIRRKGSGSGQNSNADLLTDPNSFSHEFNNIPACPPINPNNKLGLRSRNRSGKTMKTLDERARTDMAQPVMTLSNSRTIYTHGRPPWYSAEGEFKDAFLIGICGGSASGKTTVAKKIIEKLNMNWVVLLSMDCFYKDLNEEELELAAKNEWNFDAPHSFDLDMCVEMLQKLKQGRAIDCPQYDFTTHQRDDISKPIYGATVIIFEGILSMCDERLRNLMDLKIFVDTDSDVRLARRLARDMASRARDLKSVIAQYEKFVKPAYDTYIHPLIKYADIVIPRGGENAVAINLLTQQITKELNKRFQTIRSSLVNAHIGEALPDTLSVLPSTNQVKGIHTILRNKNSSRDDFIFYSNRLMRLLFEFAMAELPHEEIIINTPQKKVYKGSKFAGKGLCGVSILRAGETMENSLLKVTRDIRLGKILIQTNHDNSEPELHFLRLPQNIENEHVILMDATVATGAAAMMAIRILLDHGVLQENIILTSLLMAETGIHTVAYAYPKVKLVTTAVDKTLDENFHIVPGMGNFGDRYFGTDKSSED